MGMKASPAKAKVRTNTKIPKKSFHTKANPNPKVQKAKEKEERKDRMTPKSSLRF